MINNASFAHLTKQKLPWSTASFGAPPDTSPVDLIRLGQHLEICHRARGRLFMLECQLESAIGFLTSRVVTSVVFLTAIVGVVMLVR